MGQKYCPECKQVVITKALANYTQVEYRGVLAKKREIMHLEEKKLLQGCSMKPDSTIGLLVPLKSCLPWRQRLIPFPQARIRRMALYIPIHG